MKKIAFILISLLAAACVSAQESPKVAQAIADRESTFEALKGDWFKDHYTKTEAMIPMRDGVKIYTAIYQPKDSTEKHPVMMIRTPYSCGPYGAENYTNPVKEYYEYISRGYILVYQDVRGKNASEGKFENVRPFENGTTLDATDVYDSIDYLLGATWNNGNFGAMGVSYPGYYAMIAGLSGHPALKAVSPQAPVTDWWMGDDLHHNGAFMMIDTYSFCGSFFRDRDMMAGIEGKPEWTSIRNFMKGNAYDFYLAHSHSDILRMMHSESMPFTESIAEHPDYDEYWVSRATSGHLSDVKPAVLVVGGTFDAEDCYGAFKTYKSILTESPSTDLYFALGPWYHGGWRDAFYTTLGNTYMGECSSYLYKRDIEYPFFAYYLEGKGEKPAKVSWFAAGDSEWSHSSTWPLKGARQTKFYLAEGLPSRKPASEAFHSYISDPASPVPFIEDLGKKRPKEYMVADQSFASKRADVLTFQTKPLNGEVLMAGEVKACLKVKISEQDADFIVKVIDVSPDGVQTLVRGEVFRGRYRESFSEPKPFESGVETEVSFALPDLVHRFAKGHGIMIQVQSTWFPLADRNPQKWVDNIYKASLEDYVKQTVCISNRSYVELPIVK